MSKDMKLIYDKYVNGDSLSNTELLEGFSFYLQLAKDLNKSGPVFKLAAVEAMRIANGLEGYAKARQLLFDVPFG